MEKSLILTGWGRSEYAAAAAGALRAVGDADVIGVSMRRLVAVFESESAGRDAVYVLGVGLGDDEEAFAAAASKIAARGVAIAYLSMFEMDGAVRKMLEKVPVKLCVMSKAKSLMEVVEKFFGTELDDLRRLAAERKDGEAGHVARYQELFRAAGYMYRTNDDGVVYSEAIRSLASGVAPDAWPPLLKTAVSDYRKYGRRELIGHSPAMEKVRRRIGLAAKHPDARVLILGESGTGKETVAQQIHRKSARGSGEFVAFNCASVTPNLLEGRLFGYEKGAYTDASKTTDGLFARARGGTLFLDEIGELPQEAQGLLLGFSRRTSFRGLAALKTSRRMFA